jgi:hypothetical protein
MVDTKGRETSGNRELAFYQNRPFSALKSGISFRVGCLTPSLSEILCVRCTQSERSMYAKKDKQENPLPELPCIPKRLIDQIVTGTMDAKAVSTASEAFKKTLIEPTATISLWL